MKINVVGISGSGKSTFAKKIADKICHPYIELDSIYWGSDWKPNPNFLIDLDSSLSTNSSYVLDGNYASSDYLKWKDIDLVIWLDYSFSLSFYRCLTRTIKRLVSKETLWGTNKENISNILSKNSILYFMVTHYHKNKKKFENDMEIHSNIKFIRFKTPKEAEAFLQTIRLKIMAKDFKLNDVFDLIGE